MKLILLTGFFIFFVEIASWRDYTIIPEKLEFKDVDNKVLTNTSLYFYKFNHTSIAYSGSAKILIPLNNIEAKVDISQFHGSKYADTSMFAATVNICTVLDNKMGGMVSEVITAWMKNDGKLPTKCPIEPGYYYFNNASISEDLFPPYMPGEKWRVDITYLYQKKKIGKVMVIVKLDKTQKLYQKLG